MQGPSVAFCEPTLFGRWVAQTLNVERPTVEAEAEPHGVMILRQEASDGRFQTHSCVRPAAQLEDHDYILLELCPINSSRLF